VNSVYSNPIAAIAVIVSLAALSFSIYNFAKTRTATLYSDIDGRYYDLLKLGISNPNFVNPALTKKYKEHFKEKDLLSYEQYAFAAWNIVETIVDRRKNKELRITWDPVIKVENRLHRTWLNHPENQDKFKKAFWEFMVGNKNFPCPSCEDDSLCTRCGELLAMVKSPGDSFK
jgi:hypothetical protein